MAEDESQPMLTDEQAADYFGQPPPPYPPFAFAPYQPQMDAFAPASTSPSAPPYDPYSYQPNASPQIQIDVQYPETDAGPGNGRSRSGGSKAGLEDSSNDRPGRNGATFDANFNEKTIRMAFVKKVYSILLLQLLLTAAVVCVFMFTSPIRRYCQWHMWPVLTALSVVCILLIVLACFTEVRRKTPVNLVLLFTFTLFEGCFLGTVTVYFSTLDVLLALVITVVVVVSLTIFAFQTKWDFTMLSGCLFVAVMVVLLFGIVCLIVQNRFLDIGLASIGALIFSLYIVFDTQMMLGGKHRYSLSPEEYIFAALNLYLDIVNLFLLLLVIIGCARL